MTRHTFDVQLLRDHVSRVTLGPKLDNSNAPFMLQLISESQANGIQYIIMDCRHIELMSSAGVGSILGSVETLRQMNGDLILCNLSAQARRVLEVLDLLNYLTIATSHEEALTLCR